MRPGSRCKQPVPGSEGRRCVRLLGHKGDHDAFHPTPPGDFTPGAYASLPHVAMLVQYRMPLAYGKDAWRAAIVVGTPDVELANLLVYPDGRGDFAKHAAAIARAGDVQPGGMLYVQGAEEGDEPGDWRRPERTTY